MRKIIASVDIDSDCVKLVVGEIYNDRLNILNASKRYVKLNENERRKDAIIETLRKTIKDVSNNLGIRIKKVVLGVDCRNLRLVKSATAIKINHGNNKIINGKDVDRILEEASVDKIPDKYALVGVIPVEFTTDGDKVTNDPKGISSENLGLKSIVAMSPKSYISNMLDILNEAGLNVIDVIPDTLGDYMCFKNKTTERTVGAIINLGYDISSVSIFNRGILTNTKVYNAGCRNIIEDIGFVNRLDESTATAIYRDLVLASTRLANSKEYRIVEDVDGKKVKITQHDVSELASNRIAEILGIFKKEINILTKKQISYIIVTGRLSELRDFGLALENSLGNNGYIGNLKLIGARDNTFVSAVGIIEYFNKKLELSDRKFSILAGNEVASGHIEEKIEESDIEDENKESVFSRIFGYFFDS